MTAGGECFRRRRMQAHRMAAMTATPATPTPAPMPAIAPVLSPLSDGTISEGVGVGIVEDVGSLVALLMASAVVVGVDVLEDDDDDDAS